MQKAWLLLGLGLPALGQAQSGAPRVDVIPHAADRRVDVLVDGKPFTAYIYPTSTTLKKPTLYPLRTASGKLVTRGWPLGCAASTETQFSASSTKKKIQNQRKRCGGGGLC